VSRSKPTELNRECAKKLALPIGVYIFVGGVLVVGVGLVTVLMLGRRGRGRLIECPECWAQFGRPAYTQKTVGFGPSLPGMGNYTCPKCKHSGSVSSFKYVNEKGSNPSGK
jgi:hypothetical protein